MTENPELDEKGAKGTAVATTPKQPYDFLRDYETPLPLGDAMSAAGFRFLVAEIRKKDSEIDDLKDFRTKYYECSESNAVLRAEGKPSKLIDVLGSLTLSAGSLILGLAAKSPEYSHINLLYAVSVILIIIGLGVILSKAAKKSGS